MSDCPRMPKVPITPEACIPGVLVRAPGLEWSVLTEGVVYVVLWKRHRFCRYRKGYWWAVGLQRHNLPPYMWPKVVHIDHLEPAFGLAFMGQSTPKAQATGQLELPFG